MSNSSRNARNPLLEAISRWWPTQIEGMLQLASISSEDVLQLAMEGFDKMRTAEDLCSEAEAFPRDCLIEIARRFPRVDKAQQRRCAALVSEVLALCMTLTDDWQMQDAVGNLTRKAGEYECMTDVWNSLSPFVRVVGFGKVQDWVKEQWEGEIEETDETENTTNDISFDPKSIRLNLTAEEWVASHTEVEIGCEETYKAKIISSIRTKWNGVEKEGNWKTAAVRRLFFDAPDGNWLKSKESLSHSAFCELIQSEEVTHSTYSRAKNSRR